MVIRRKFLLAASTLALAACQQPPATTLTPLPAPADVKAGAASQRVSGAVAADQRTQPEPEVSPGAAAGTTKPHLPPGTTGGDVLLNFADTDIREIVRQVLGKILQVNYSIDPAVHGTATIETAKPLKRDELLPTLELLLNQNGASLVQNGELYRVLPSATAVATPSLAQQQTSGTELITLRYASAKDLAKVLEPFVAEGARVIADPNRNMLLISGEPSARRTLTNLIASFDTDILAGQSFAIFPVTDADPSKVATELQKALLTEGDAPLNGVARVIPMDRINAVLVISSQPRYIAAAERLFHLIERSRKDTARSWHVYYIQNGQANDVANVLQRAFTPNNVTAKPDSTSLTAPGVGQGSIGSGQSGFGSNTSSPLGGSNALGSSGATGQTSGLGSPSLFGGSNQSGQSGSSTFGAPNSGSNSGDNSASTESLSASSQQGGNSTNTIRIIPNKQNNALLIYATPEEESTIESMLHKIDIIPLQVRIDATIAEVDINDTLQYGTQFFFKNKGVAGALTQAGLNTAPLVSNFASFSNFSGFSLSNGGDVQFVLQALQAVTNVRVLSSPQLMVLDNQVAKLLVGDSVPYNSGTLETLTNGTASPAAATTTNYQQTGVIMQILPHVNSSGLVTLDIAQEVSAVVPQAESTSTPTFSDRQVTTRVVVQDGQTIGIAGLIQDQTSRSNQGIPFLKDIPILGAAFSDQNNQRTRTELLVMITPHVIQDQRDALKLTEDMRENLSHAGLVPQQLQTLPFSGSSNPNGDLTPQ